MNIEALCQNISNRFSQDKTVPSVIVAWLEESSRYYVSIVRYRGEYADGKVVLCNVTGPSLEQCYTEVYNKLCDMRADPIKCVFLTYDSNKEMAEFLRNLLTKHTKGELAQKLGKTIPWINYYLESVPE